MLLLFYERQQILTEHTAVFSTNDFSSEKYWFSIKNIWRLYLYFSLKNSISFIPDYFSGLFFSVYFFLLYGEEFYFPRQWTFFASIKRLCVSTSRSRGDDTKLIPKAFSLSMEANSFPFMMQNDGLSVKTVSSLTQAFSVVFQIFSSLLFKSFLWVHVELELIINWLLWIYMKLLLFILKFCPP